MNLQDRPFLQFHPTVILVFYNLKVIFDFYNFTVISWVYNFNVISILRRREFTMLPITSPRMLGKMLRRYRKELGLTQTEAGFKFNIPQKTVSNIEAGLPGVRLASIFKYMSALGLEMQLDYRNRNTRDKEIW